MSILDHQPLGMDARPWQVPVLEEIEKYWEGKEVFVIPGPVAFGKSYIAMVVARWMRSRGKTTGIITPRIALQNQYAESFPNTPTLKGKSRYSCKGGGNCQETQEIQKSACPGCPHTQARLAVSESSIAIYNISSYHYSQEKKARDVVIIDEAHMLLDFMFEEFTITLWEHKENYPENLLTAGDVGIWLEKQIGLLSSYAKDEKDVKTLKRLKRKISKFKRVRKGIDEAPANFFVEKNLQDFHGMKKACLKIRPTTMRGLTSLFWDNNTHKILLMSATLNKLDLRKLGVSDHSGHRVHWVKCEDPISSSCQPIDLSWGTNMSYKYQDKNVPALEKKILELADKHPESGICHLTYRLSKKLKKHLKGSRFIWHTPSTREEALQEFMKGEGKILMGCGMGEGLDLAGQKFTWQTILKIPFPSMADMLIAKWYKEDPAWITWKTVQAVIQQCGRICRGPSDYGVTYILDSAIGNIAKKRRGLLQSAQEYNYLPKNFLNRIVWK